MPNKKSSKKEKRAAFATPIVNILLESASYTFDFFVDHFRKKWQLTFSPCREENSLGMIIENMVVGCVFVPFPIVENALIQSARDNVLWPEAEAVVTKHKAHLKVTLARESDPVSAHILLSKVVYSLLHQKNVVGVYYSPGLFEPAYYIKCAENLTAKKLPTELWVHINQIGFNTEEGFSFFTSGMNNFNKKEFEIVDTKTNFIDAYYFLKELIKFTIENNVNYKDGDIAGIEDNKTPLSVSKGVRVKGPTIKIGI